MLGSSARKLLQSKIDDENKGVSKTVSSRLAFINSLRKRPFNVLTF